MELGEARLLIKIFKNFFSQNETIYIFEILFFQHFLHFIECVSCNLLKCEFTETHKLFILFYNLIKFYQINEIADKMNVGWY